MQPLRLILIFVSMAAADYVHEIRQEGWRHWRHTHNPLVYVHRPTCKIDTFFDRVVSIVYEAPSILYFYGKYNHRPFTSIAMGVMISEDLILSSYNPYRLLERQNYTLAKMVVSVMIRRLIEHVKTSAYYTFCSSSETIIYDLQCGRKVIPEETDIVRDDMMHGMHRPQHDLMVMRVAPKIVFADPVPRRQFNFDGQLIDSNIDKKWPELFWSIHVGRIKTIVAGPNDLMDRDIYWVSIGHTSLHHLNTVMFTWPEYDTIESIVDCEEWFPRFWGRFICLRNHNNFPGLASGSMLFSKDMLFGVGSFALWKLKKGILVFTDVRYYSGLLFNTCTVSDQKNAD